MPLEEGENAEIGSEGFGETDVEAVSEDIIEEPSYDFLEIDDDLANKYVRVKVDGEDISVPLNEALQGYSRTADYTRKTQDLARSSEQAQEALRLQQAFQANPGLTVQVLASQAGMSVEQFLGLTSNQQQAALAEPEDEYLDPLERMLHEERSARLALESRIEQREADERLSNAVGGLKQQFGATDDQARAVVYQAMQMNLGIDSFPMIYQAMAYQAQQQATAQHTAGQDAEATRRRQAAQAASRVVSTGSGVPDTTEVQPVGKYNSIREAAMAAIDEVEARASR